MKPILIILFSAFSLTLAAQDQGVAGGVVTIRGGFQVIEVPSGRITDSIVMIDSTGRLNKISIDRITVTGGTIDTTSLSNRINLKLNKTDTANKWITTIYRRNDSVFYVKGGNETFAFIDSVGSGGGGGSVTNFSAGDLSPLFTTSEATTTTTPALSFSLSNAAANTYFGNNTGSTAAPAMHTFPTIPAQFNLIAGTNITLSGSYPNITATAAGSSVASVFGRTGLVTAAQGDYNFGQITKTVTTVTISTHNVTFEDILFVNYTGGTNTTTLPAASLSTGRVIWVRNLNPSNNVILSGMEVNEPNTMAPSASWTVTSNGTDWFIIGH